MLAIPQPSRHIPLVAALRCLSCFPLALELDVCDYKQKGVGVGSPVFKGKYSVLPVASAFLCLFKKVSEESERKNESQATAILARSSNLIGVWPLQL